jgi:uncharacterized protein YegP (UPF0339 family)
MGNKIKKSIKTELRMELKAQNVRIIIVERRKLSRNVGA